MTIQDPIANFLTCIRNGQQAKHKHVIVPVSIIKIGIAKILTEEGYILSYKIQDKFLILELKYYNNNPVIKRIVRISKPGLRIYCSHIDLKSIPGFGISILSTSKGIITNIMAKKLHVGGEVLCEIS